MGTLLQAAMVPDDALIGIFASLAKETFSMPFDMVVEEEEAAQKPVE